MKQIIWIALLCLSLGLRAQNTNDSSSVLKQESKVELITKYRNLLMDNVIDAKQDKIRELISQLKTYDNEYYVALFPSECRMLYLILKDYDALTNELANIDTSAISSIRNKVTPSYDGLAQLLIQYTTRNSSNIASNIQSTSELSEEDKRLLQIVLSIYSTSNKKNSDEQINKTATQFLNDFPGSRYETYIRQYVRYQFAIDFTWGLEMYGGALFLSGDLATIFNNSGLFGMGFIWGYKQFFLNTRVAFGGGDPKVDPSTVWTKSTQASFFLPEISLAYKFVPTKRLSISPLLGTTWFISQPSLSDKNEKPYLKNISIDATIAPIAGVDFGWEFYNEYFYRPLYNRTMYAYYSLNLRYTIQPAAFPESTVPMDGLIQSITLSFKMGAGAAKRIY